MSGGRHIAGARASSGKEKPGPKDVGSKILGATGELLITAGVVVLLFILWQLWWSDVQSAQAQAALQEEVPWIVPLDQLPDGSAQQQDPATQLPPVLSLPTGEGDLFATLLVPAWGEDYQRTVHQGVDKRIVLDALGIGHFPEAVGPGEQGNFALAAHRTTFGRPFHNMHDLAAGDAVVVRTEDTWFVYRITVGPYIVDPYQIGVVAPVPFLLDDDAPAASSSVPVTEVTADGDLRRLITLVACHPLYSARERIVVHGELESWQPTSAGIPAAALEYQGEGK